MRAFFNLITSLSLRFWPLTLLITAAIIGGGVYSFTQFNQELLPSISFPQTFIVAQNNGASSDQILTLYTIPIEERAQAIDEVVNIETISNGGFALITVRNAFGADQDRIVSDLRAALNELPLPLRSVTPTEGQRATDLINELSPEAVLWLYNWARIEESGFIPQLSSDALRAFSPEALAALPASAFNELDSATRAEILSDTPTETELPQIFDTAFVPAPALPASWQGDPRFATVEDLVELTTTRNLASVFNDFVSNDYLRGPLGKTNDITLADIDIILAAEASCRALERPEGSTDSCSFIGELDASHILTLPEEIIAALPSDYLEQLSLIDQNEIAAAFAAEAISGQQLEREPVLLPDTWRADAPSIITFSFSDIPLGSISVDSQTMDAAQLRAFVEDEMTPRLREVDLVANVVIDGGEIIPDTIQRDTIARINEQRAANGLEPLVFVESNNGSAPASESTEDESESAEGETDQTGLAAAPPPAREYPEGPALPPVWGTVASFIGAESFETADDIMKLIGTEISGLPILSAADFINALESQPTAAILLETLTPEVLDYLSEQEPNFNQNISPSVRAAALGSPVLGESWSQLSRQLGDGSFLQLASDLDERGAVETIATIINNSQNNGANLYAIQLMNSLQPEALEALAESNPDFLNELAAEAPNAIRYLSREALQTEVVSSFLAETNDNELVAELQAILDGEATAAERALAGFETTLFEDPNATTLPASWPGVAPFVGVSQLNTTADVMNVPGYTSAADLLSAFALGQGQGLVRDLRLENWLDLIRYDQELRGVDLFGELNASAVLLISLTEEEIAQLPQDAQARIAAGGEPYNPRASVTRTDGNPSLLVTVFKEDGANTVIAWDNLKVELDRFNERDDITVTEVFEQASFITSSLEGVQREGTTGAIMAIVMILIFMNVSVRSTAVVSVSIPGSVMFALVLLNFVPQSMNSLLAPLVDDLGRDTFLGSIMVVIVRLFPAEFTLNIMTLSGLTVAIGRVVDDSIVVLENIYRNIGLMRPDEDNAAAKRQAILNGTKEVSVAIFSATLTTMVVFLPLGLFGGVVGAFFLPFGLAVAYALIGSYTVAITTIPVLAMLFISRQSMPEEGVIALKPEMSGAQKAWARFANVFIGSMEWLGLRYSYVIRWALKNRWVVIAGAFLLLFGGLYLMGQRPVQFLPAFGEPTISVTISLPPEFQDRAITLAETNAKVEAFEAWLFEQREAGAGITAIQTTVGSSGGFSFGGGGGGVTQTAANLSIAVESPQARDELVPIVREQAEIIFNDLNYNGLLDYEEFSNGSSVIRSNVSVSGQDLASGGFGGFSVVLRGADANQQPTLAELAAYNETILMSLNEIDGLVNVELESAFGGGDSTYVRIDGVPALRYTGEIESADTQGITRLAVEETQKAVDSFRADHPELTTPVEVSQGFDSEEQAQGILEIFISMGIATIIAYIVLTITFGNFILPLEILVSLPLAVVGAAVGLTVTDRVLGLPAMVGLLMLVGIVLTNAIVFLDRVQQNRRERNMGRDEALIEAGRTRLRPILMTAATTTIAQLPLAASTESGAIIAAELGTVVIGGLISSTILTLLVLPVVYSLVHGGLDRGSQFVRRRLGLSGAA